MLGNAYRAQLGVPVAPILAAGVRWGLPWILTAAGIGVTALAVKGAFPEVPINREKIGIAALLGGGGVTSYLVSDVIPESYRPIAYALAVAGVSGALYFLFTPPEPPPPPAPAPGILPAEVPAAQRVPGTAQAPYPTGQLAQILRVQLDPAQTAVGGTWRNKYADQDYAFSIINQGDRTLSFYVGLRILDDEGSPITPSTDPTFPSGRSPVAPTIYGRQLVTLRPRETKSMTLKAPAFGGWFAVASFNTTVAVELFRNRDDQEPFMVSDSISIQQVPPYYAGFG